MASDLPKTNKNINSNDKIAETELKYLIKYLKNLLKFVMHTDKTLENGWQLISSISKNYL